MQKNTYEMLRVLTIEVRHLRQNLKDTKAQHERDLNEILYRINSMDKALTNSSQLDLFKEQAE